MMSIAQVRSAEVPWADHTDTRTIYDVLGSMGERWAGRGAEQLGCRAVSIGVFTLFGGETAGRSGFKPHAGWQ